MVVISGNRLLRLCYSLAQAQPLTTSLQRGYDVDMFRGQHMFRPNCTVKPPLKMFQVSHSKHVT